MIGSVRPALFTAPEHVPAHVDTQTLMRAIELGRPAASTSWLGESGRRFPLLTLAPMTQSHNRPACAPLLFVHGLGHDAWDFTPLASALGAGPACPALYAVDLPGFGLADKPATLGIDDLVAALLAAAAALPAPPLVVASSLGGHVALLAALASPHTFAGLALLSPGGLVEVSAAMQAMLRGYYSAAAIAARPDAEIVGNSRRIFARGRGAAAPLPEAACEDDALAARKLAVHRSPERARFAASFAAVVDDVFRHVVLDRLERLAVPTWFTVGSADVVVPAPAVRDGAARARAPFHVWDGVGHCPHLEAPAAVAALLRQAHADVSASTTQEHTHDAR